MSAAYPRRAAGAKLVTSPDNRSVVNVGTISMLPFPPAGQAGVGQAHRPLMTSGWGGVFVVVRARESRVHGEGRQQTGSGRTARAGGRW